MRYLDLEEEEDPESSEDDSDEEEASVSAEISFDGENNSQESNVAPSTADDSSKIKNKKNMFAIVFADLTVQKQLESDFKSISY